MSPHQTLIHVHALFTVTSKTSVTFTAECTRGVDASGVVVAVVSHENTFVDVGARFSVSVKPSVARA